MHRLVGLAGGDEVSGVGGGGCCSGAVRPQTQWLFVVIGPLPSSAKCHMCSQAVGVAAREQ